MARRLLLLGLAATSMAVPAAAQTALPAQTGLATIQHAQSAYYSVRNVQELLSQLGYDAGPADGIMGSRTQAAIMAYQRDQGLPVTGAADAQLYAHMLEAAGAAAATSGAATTGTTTATTPGTTVVTSGQTVVDVQTELRRRGYDIPMITGQWDVPTRDAVLAYQRDAGLAQTGYIDEALAESLTTSTTASADQRELVRDIQVALSRRGYNVGPADGTISPLTQAAIRTYEADAGLPVTGTASAALLARLEGETAGTGVASETATVMAVQDELIARGYLQGEADGVMGSATSAAIRQFQQDAGLEVTGTADETLLARLRATDLTRGDANREEITAEIERLLQAKGYRVGPVDGVVDAQTEVAIRAFQQDAGLPVDGRADRNLLSEIRTSEVTAAPLTPEQAVQGIVQGATTRLLESLANPGQQPAE